MRLELREIRINRWTYITICSVACTAVAAGFGYRHTHAKGATAVQAAGAHGENRTGGAKAHRAAVASPLVASSAAAPMGLAWIPTINDTKTPRPAPADTVWIPGGPFWMGSADEHTPDTKPPSRVYIDGYWMDRTEVTNEQFARFVKATGYVTVAERKARAEDFPEARPKASAAGAAVFTPPGQSLDLNDQLQWWSYIHGANWRHPEGTGSDIQNRMNHPVQIAYEDGVAYCKWVSKR